MPGANRGMSVRIRPFVPADYDRVMELWAEGGLPLKPRGRDSRKSVRRQIGLPNVLFLVAEEGKRGRVVGTVVATHDGRKGWVNRVAVEERLRRRGLGARLVRAAEAWLEAQGMDILACLVEAGNAVSMAVFGKLGYTKHPEIVYFAKRRFPGA